MPQLTTKREIQEMSEVTRAYYHFVTARALMISCKDVLDDLFRAVVKNCKPHLTEGYIVEYDGINILERQVLGSQVHGFCVVVTHEGKKWRYFISPTIMSFPDMERALADKILMPNKGERKLLEASNE